MTRDRRDRRSRTGLRETDRHASWREVYVELDVDPNQHETTPEAAMYQGVPNTLDVRIAASHTNDR